MKQGKKNAEKCTELDGNFYSCANAADKSSCPYGAAVFGVGIAGSNLDKAMQQLFTCEWQDWANCGTQAACEASGICDDWDYRDWMGVYEGYCVEP